MKKELTRTKLNNILKKYKQRLATHEKEWEDLCAKYHSKNIKEKSIFYTPSIFEHQSHTSAGDKLFKNIMAEFEEYYVFHKKN